MVLPTTATTAVSVYAHVLPLIIPINICIKSITTLVSVDNSPLWGALKEGSKEHDSPIKATSQTRSQLSNYSYDLNGPLHIVNRKACIPRAFSSSLAAGTLAFGLYSHCSNFRKTRTVYSLPK